MPVLHAATNPYRVSATRSAFAVILSVLLFVGSTGWFVYRDLAGDIAGNVIALPGVDPQSGSTQAEEKPKDSFAGRAVNILVSGIDSRYGQGASAYGDSSELATIQSDTTMVVHISADRSRLEVISVPRDLVTDIPSCTRTDGSVTEPYEGQFNSAFATGAVTDDIASGISCTKTAVEHLTGLHMDAFVVVDFKGFQGMIDALGGVWYYLAEPAQDEEADLDLPAGCQKLDGVQALAYARARKHLGDGSDIERIGRQQQLVAAMMRELLSKNLVTDLPAMVTFLKQAVGSLQTSPDLANLNTDVGLLLSLGSIDRSGIRFVTMPWGLADWNENRVVATEPEASELWAALAADQPLPVGTAYTDGNGTAGTVEPPADPSTQQSGEGAVAPEPTESSPEGTTEPEDPSAPTEPGTATPPPPPCPPDRTSDNSSEDSTDTDQGNAASVTGVTGPSAPGTALPLAAGRELAVLTGPDSRS